MTSLAETLKARGFVFQHSGDSLDGILKEKRTLYHGIDPTADSLHVGHLMSLLLARRLMQAGHKVVVLVGGGTGAIGDPSGKSNERVLLDQKTLNTNVKNVTKQLGKIFGGTKFTVLNNEAWLGKLNVIAFLRDIGKHFSVNEMVRKETVRRRLEDPNATLSYTEFTYSLLQAYDFFHLNQKHGCDLQIGGSDQWGNITAGIELIRKKTGKEVHGITTPLLTDPSTGKKFGKTEGGAVWLDPEKTSPFEFYQFWVNTGDAEVVSYLKLFTEVSEAQIEELAVETNTAAHARSAQKKLAHAVTELVHGKKAADSSARVSEALFGVGMPHLSSEEKKLLIASSPSFCVKGDMGLVDVLVDSGLVSSKREAREVVENGGVTLGVNKITDVTYVVSKALLNGSVMLLRKGKRDVRVLYTK